MFYIFQVLSGSGANIRDMVVQALEVDKSGFASVASWHTIVYVFHCKQSESS
jgi:hypothetical protein